ncbi:5'-methylthioadenosine/adenosylhomocysteine nucleosidase [Agaribacter flavus]|uniref:5'-methylthioadenosine/S-adenosylhomocysteine nucleosidase n=1 Tax=Agaribacter flavus TaxID=1902781 RepID=A0ABV7FVL1_9ALTE
MKIAIIGAMQEEVEKLKSALINQQQIKHNYLEVFTGNLSHHEIFLVQSGIGKVAAAVATSILIQSFKPDLVINTGSAGGFDPDLNIGDIVVADSLAHHDANVTSFGYELGQLPAMPSQFVADANFSRVAFDAAKNLKDVTVKTGLICSGDQFVCDDKTASKIQENFPSMKAVEMESAAIAQCCHMMDTPFVIIRSLSDIAGKTSTISFEQYLVTAAENSARLVLSMIDAI